MNQGPLLITIDEGIIQVVPELVQMTFDLDCSCDVWLASSGSLIEGSKDYHLLIYGVGLEAEFPQIRLYHSENGAVEELPFRYQDGFSQDGKWILLYKETFNTQSRRPIRQYALRSVDPLGSEITYLTDQARGSLFPMPWSPDGAKFALTTWDGILVYSLPEAELSGTWDLGNFYALEGLWSPDGARIALRGAQPWADSIDGFFVIDVNSNRILH
jgi:Tol biopolymer transport system component